MTTERDRPPVELSHAGHWRLRRRYEGQADPVWLAIEPISADLIPVPRA